MSPLPIPHQQHEKAGVQGKGEIMQLSILKFSEEGATFLFGNLVTDTKSFGYIFAFQVFGIKVEHEAVGRVAYAVGIGLKLAVSNLLDEIF